MGTLWLKKIEKGFPDTYDLVWVGEEGGKEILLESGHISFVFAQKACARLLGAMGFRVAQEGEKIIITKT